MDKDIGSSMYVLKRMSHPLESIVIFILQTENIQKYNLASAGFAAKVSYLLVVGF